MNSETTLNVGYGVSKSGGSPNATEKDQLEGLFRSNRFLGQISRNITLRFAKGGLMKNSRLFELCVCCSSRVESG